MAKNGVVDGKILKVIGVIGTKLVRAPGAKLVGATRTKLVGVAAFVGAPGYTGVLV